MVRLGLGGPDVEDGTDGMDTQRGDVERIGGLRSGDLVCKRRDKAARAMAGFAGGCRAVGETVPRLVADRGTARCAAECRSR